MDKSWFSILPDFNDGSEWLEVEPQSYYFDPKSRNILRCKLGTAPEDLLLGMAILKRNSANPKLFLLEYRDIDGHGPYVLKWWEEGDHGNLCGIAILVGKDWRVKSEFQIFIWNVSYDFEKKCVMDVTPTLEPIKRTLNN